MLFAKDPRKLLLNEAAAGEALDPEVSKEVEDTIEELEDVLTRNIDPVKDADKTTNGGVPVVSEAVALMEATNTYGTAKYLITLEAVMAIMETEGEKAAEAMQEPDASEPATPEECEAAEPNPVNVIEDIAEKNGVDPEQVAVVIKAESVSFVAKAALYEQSKGKTGKDAVACKRLQKINETINNLNGTVAMLRV